MKRILFVTAITFSSFATANLLDCSLTRAEAIDKNGNTIQIKHTTLGKFEIDPENPKAIEIKESKKIQYHAFCFAKKSGPCVGPRDTLTCGLLRIKKPKKARFDVEKFFSDWANEDACRGILRPVPFAMTNLETGRLDFSHLINVKTADTLRCKAK